MGSRRMAGSIAALALILAGCGSDMKDGPDAAGQPTAATSGATVKTTLLAFEPATLTVQPGTTVTWQVSDTIGHTVTTGTFSVGGDGLRTKENPDGVVDKPLKRGEDVSFTFDKPGTYTYFCSIHKGMHGEVVVTA